MLISFVIPTRNRPLELANTLARLGELSPTDLGGDSELVIVDNASARTQYDIPDKLGNGIRIRSVGLDENMGAAARNIGVERASGDWVVMLDDDSHLLPGDPVGAYLASLDDRVAAVGGEIVLPSGDREAGGLPEVIIGCGCAVRRDAYLAAGGYDASFGYYVEEYDLCARLIVSGFSIKHTRALRFEHRKSSVGRDLDEIIYRLVRNNGWVIQRYAPPEMLDAALGEMHRRYEQIAIHERAVRGFERGRRELAGTIGSQKRTPLSIAQWDRFTGDHALREALGTELGGLPPSTVTIAGPKRGKGLVQIRGVIEACGHQIVDDDAADPMDPAALSVIGTLSPGPMLDTMDRFPDALAPWSIEGRRNAAVVVPSSAS